MSEIKKKILYLVTLSEWGGAQKYIFDLATNLPADFEAIVAAGEGDGTLLAKLRNKQIKTIKLNNVVRKINPFKELKGLTEIKRLIQELKPDIVHLNSSKLSILGSLAIKLSGLKPQVVYTSHGWVFNEPLVWPLKKMYYYLEKWTTKFKHIIITVSECDRQIALKYRLADESKIVSIHNCLNPDEINFLDKDTALDELNQKLLERINFSEDLHNYKIIGTIANLYATKGINFLIETAEKVIKQFPDTLFIVIGEGPLKEQLKHRLFKANLKKKFLLAGDIKNASSLLKAFDLFVLPSVKEGFPYTILEALAAKLPIIATRVGGIPEILQENCLVPPKNVEILTMKISDWLKNPSYLTDVFDFDQEFKNFLEKTYSLYADRSPMTRG